MQKDAFEEWFRPTLMEAGYEGIFQPSPGGGLDGAKKRHGCSMSGGFKMSFLYQVVSGCIRYGFGCIRYGFLRS